MNSTSSNDTPASRGEQTAQTVDTEESLYDSTSDRNHDRPKHPQVIGSTEIQAKNEGTKAFRIVLRFFGAGASTPYATHMETFDDYGQSDGHHYGDYCGSMGHGYESLKRRAKKYSLRVLDSNGKRIPLKTLDATI